jgi:hypothetical protein
VRFASTVFSSSRLRKPSSLDEDDDDGSQVLFRLMFELSSSDSCVFERFIEFTFDVDRLFIITTIQRSIKNMYCKMLWSPEVHLKIIMFSHASWHVFKI